MGVLTDLVKTTTTLLYADPACAADVTTPTLKDVSAYEGWGIAIIVAKLVSGTPTADVKLVESATVSGAQTDVASGAFTQCAGSSAVTYTIPVNFDACLGWLGAYVDVAGGTPVIGISVVVVGQKKYN